MLSHAKKKNWKNLTKQSASQTSKHTTLFWRCNNVKTTSCACWETHSVYHRRSCYRRQYGNWSPIGNNFWLFLFFIVLTSDNSRNFLCFSSSRGKSLEKNPYVTFLIFLIFSWFFLIFPSLYWFFAAIKVYVIFRVIWVVVVKWERLNAKKLFPCNWGSTLPIKELGYELKKQEFWEVRYDWPLNRVWTESKCAFKWSFVRRVSRSLSIKKGGFITLRHKWGTRHYHERNWYLRS